MSYKKGKVQSILVKETREGKFGKFANYALKIDDAYYNGIASEHNGAIKVQDSAYALITEGSEVEFMFATNDKGYNDIDKKTLKVLGAVTATPTSEQPKAPGTTVTTTAGTAMKLNALDIAVSIAALEYRDKDVPNNLAMDLIEKADKILNWANK